MARKRYQPEQIVAILREAETTFHRWKALVAVKSPLLRDKTERSTDIWIARGAVANGFLGRHR